MNAAVTHESLPEATVNRYGIALSSQEAGVAPEISATRSEAFAEHFTGQRNALDASASDVEKIDDSMRASTGTAQANVAFDAALRRQSTTGPEEGQDVQSRVLTSPKVDPSSASAAQSAANRGTSSLTLPSLAPSSRPSGQSVNLLLPNETTGVAPSAEKPDFNALASAASTRSSAGIRNSQSSAALGRVAAAIHAETSASSESSSKVRAQGIRTASSREKQQSDAASTGQDDPVGLMSAAWTMSLVAPMPPGTPKPPAAPMPGSSSSVQAPPAEVHWKQYEAVTARLEPPVALAKSLPNTSAGLIDGTGKNATGKVASFPVGDMTTAEGFERVLSPGNKMGLSPAEQLTQVADAGRSGSDTPESLKAPPMPVSNRAWEGLPETTPPSSQQAASRAANSLQVPSVDRPMDSLTGILEQPGVLWAAASSRPASDSLSVFPPSAAPGSARATVAASGANAPTANFHMERSLDTSKFANLAEAPAQLDSALSRSGQVSLEELPGAAAIHAEAGKFSQANVSATNPLRDPEIAGDLYGRPDVGDVLAGMGAAAPRLSWEAAGAAGQPGRSSSRATQANAPTKPVSGTSSGLVAGSMATRLFSGAGVEAAPSGGKTASLVSSLPIQGITSSSSLGGHFDSPQVSLPGTPHASQQASSSTNPGSNPFQAIDDAGRMHGGWSSGDTRAYAGSVSGAQLQVGFEDPALGYIELKAHHAGGEVHAELGVQSDLAGQALQSHLGSLAGWLHDRNTPAASLTVHSLDSSAMSGRGAAGHPGEGGGTSGKNHADTSGFNSGTQQTSPEETPNPARAVIPAILRPQETQAFAQRPVATETTTWRLEPETIATGRISLLA